MERPDLEQQIRERQQAWMAAVQQRDFDALEEILAREYMLISARLGFVDRQAWLEAVKSYTIEGFEYLDSTIYVYGDTAVSNSRFRQKATFDGSDLSVTFFLTDVWTFRDGRWQVVTRHSSIPVEGDGARSKGGRRPA